MRWRPSNWENPHRGRTLKVHCLDGLITTEPRDDEAVHAMIFEAGADAMLEALRIQGNYYGFFLQPAPDRIFHIAWNCSGWLIWIPDDTEKEEADGRAN